ncbi:MAG: hypothetical protein R3246_09570, partial [Acidimicrobiia bacterium]|nr:hypothetical protein [Acidimicrobiia bacterium]
ISELSSQLRATSGAEIVEEWEITERDTEQGRRRARTLGDVWEQAMHRGDRVTVSGAFGTCSGAVEFVGTDYAVVEADGAVWDVVLATVAAAIRRSTSGGHTVTGGSRTLRARLAEYEASGETITIHTDSTTITGAIGVAAKDHLIVTGEVDTVIPYAIVRAISRVHEGSTR